MIELKNLIGLQEWNVILILGVFVLKSKCDSLVLVSETRGLRWPNWGGLDGALQIRTGG